ncbi:hypothetical protein KPSA1_01127 [Pseudomonas syringae pv. actinidiae]|uniref:Uncharacterized protein n=1 Tax=Pseudomonas syringae pv. actinidiae TaxID=103796 RepID=A0A2V0Q6D0_PSESF|nr:hypothetical protein KPSA1_01127 [Pseudomonas syringae pv. actinidiae]
MQILVGASRATLRLLAKTMVQTLYFHVLYRPFREQARPPRRCLTLSVQRV